MTTGPSTGTANCSIKARRSQACRTRSGWRPSRSCGRLCRPAPRSAQLALRWILMMDERELRDSRREDAGSGPRQRRRRDPPASGCGNDGGRARRLRPTHPPARASAVVGDGSQAGRSFVEEVPGVFTMDPSPERKHRLRLVFSPGLSVVVGKLAWFGESG